MRGIVGSLFGVEMRLLRGQGAARTILPLVWAASAEIALLVVIFVGIVRLSTAGLVWLIAGTVAGFAWSWLLMQFFRLGSLAAGAAPQDYPPLPQRPRRQRIVLCSVFAVVGIAHTPLVEAALVGRRTFAPLSTFAVVASHAPATQRARSDKSRGEITTDGSGDKVSANVQGRRTAWIDVALLVLGVIASVSLFCAPIWFRTSAAVWPLDVTNAVSARVLILRDYEETLHSLQTAIWGAQHPRPAGSFFRDPPFNTQANTEPVRSRPRGSLAATLEKEKTDQDGRSAILSVTGDVRAVLPLGRRKGTKREHHAASAVETPIRVQILHAQVNSVEDWNPARFHYGNWLELHEFASTEIHDARDETPYCELLSGLTIADAIVSEWADAWGKRFIEVQGRGGGVLRNIEPLETAG